jgi:hypothetical protein
VVRGLLPCAEHRPEYMAYIWDCNESRLYIDKNRNGDLTDDPTGVYESHFAGYRRGRSSQFFHDIEIVLLRESLQCKYIMYMHFDRPRPDRMWRTMFVRSGFSGQMELGGEKWGIEISDNLDGVFNKEDRLTLFPHHPGQDVQLGSGLPLGETLFIDGRFYRYDYAFATDANQPKVRLNMTEQQAPLGLKPVFNVESGCTGCRPLRLHMDFKIVGQDGETYWSFGPNNMPKFAVFKGESKVYSGVLGRINGYTYSTAWPVPIYLSGKLRIVAHCEIASVGRLESKPVSLNWHVWKSVPRSPWSWLALILAIVLVRSNWNPQVLWLAIPLIVIRLGLSLLGETTGIPPDMADALEFVGWPMAIGLSVVLLLGTKLGRCRKPVALVLVLLVLGSIGMKSLSYKIAYMDLPSLMLVLYGTVLMIAALTSRCCRKRLNRWHFMLWLILWTLVCSILAMMIACLFLNSLLGVNTFMQMRPYTITLAGMLLLILLPFALLGMLNQFYRTRFFGLLGLGDVTKEAQEIQWPDRRREGRDS